MNTIYHNAKRFIERGIAVIPVIYRDKQPAVKWTEYQERLPTDTELQSWFPANHHNYAVIAGWQDLVILDFDSIAEYGKWAIWIQKKNTMFGKLSYKVTTNRGIHVYFRMPFAKNMKIKNGAGDPIIDIQAQNKYVLGPGSTHPSGREYTELSNNMIFPVVQALSDVLPTSLITANTEHKPGIKIPNQQTVISNPWDVINQPQVSKSVDNIKREYKIEDFFTQKYRTSNDSRFYITTCPFHNDKNPSFWIDTEQQICNCYSCGDTIPMDVINLYAKLHNISNNDAITEMAKSITK